MIATRAGQRANILGRLQAPLVGALILLVSVFAAASILMIGELAAGAFLLCGCIALTIWRARYGMYAVLFLAVLFEPMRDDPVMYYGWLIQSNISSTTPLGFVNFSPIELLVAVTAIVVLAGALVERRPLRIGVLGPLVFVFLALITASLAWGIIRGGNLTIALWEVRSLYLACLIALLLPNIFHTRRHFEHAIGIVTLAVTLLSIETIWRRFALVDTGVLPVLKDMAFAHESPILMNFVIILLLARLVWPASGWQRFLVLLVPLLLFAQMVTERRAGWVSLDIGLVLVAIFIFRMKRRVFYLLVLPLLFVYMGYLAAFWNAEGTLAQPARAVRSINDPEGRDQSSNLYRMIERANIRENVRAHPITGLGFGQKYTFYYGLPDLSFWVFWHYIPHNGVLWIWMKMGPVGFITFLTLAGVGLVRGVQILKRSSGSSAAPMLVANVSLLMMIVVFCYVDIGLNNTRVAVMFGLALGFISTWGLTKRMTLIGEDDRW